MAKTYVSGMSCKAKMGQFGEFFNISLNLETLKQYVNEKGYVNVVMSKRREPGQYGETHYFTLNEWTPQSVDSGNQTKNEQEVNVEDIPF